MPKEDILKMLNELELITTDMQGSSSDVLTAGKTISEIESAINRKAQPKEIVALLKRLEVVLQDLTGASNTVIASGKLLQSIQAAVESQRY